MKTMNTTLIEELPPVWESPDYRPTHSQTIWLSPLNDYRVVCLHWHTKAHKTNFIAVQRRNERGHWRHVTAATSRRNLIDRVRERLEGYVEDDLWQALTSLPRDFTDLSKVEPL